MCDRDDGRRARQLWARHMARIGADHGAFERLSHRHMALFVQEDDPLVLTFSRADHVWDRGIDGLPLGFGLVQARAWSLLSLMSVGPTGFRDQGVSAFLAHLARERFFASFPSILILATGPDSAQAAIRMRALLPQAHLVLTRPSAATARLIARDQLEATGGTLICALDDQRESEATVPTLRVPISADALDAAIAAPRMLVPLSQAVLDGSLTDPDQRAGLIELAVAVAARQGTDRPPLR
ncbi:hypothetical protein V8J82_00570 [Gymnodinialimonas sp. 2305UL16-5]|uniref:hypothetical protein n=1 Tax=Gymnodinialimonas mytili TaxID=3126503 RepID=UPI0030A410E8